MKVTTSFFQKEKWSLRYQHNKVTNYVDNKHLYHKRHQCHVLNPIEDKSDEEAQTWFENSSTKSDKLLFGPASCITTKRVIYPCDKMGCFIFCPCSHCQSDLVKSDLTPEKLLEDHQLYHHANHGNCVYCSNLLECFPSFSNTIFVKYFTGFTKFILVPQKRYIFKHGCRSQPESKEEQLRCEDCGKTFSHASKKYRHIKSVHLLKVHKCQECGKQFSRKDHHDRHVKDIHNAVELECEDCGKSFNRCDNYVRHRLAANYICNECGKTFCSLKNLTSHFAKEHGLYKCDDCGKTFDKISNLEDHRSYTTKCTICAESFCTKRQMVEHKKTTHPAEKFQCDQCKKEFSVNWLLKRHIREAVESACDKCDKVFCNTRALNTHKFVTHKSILKTVKPI